MRNILILAFLLAGGIYSCVVEPAKDSTDEVNKQSITIETTGATTAAIYTSDDEMQALFDDEISEEQVLIKGEVIKNLPDDNDGSRHQKFIVELNSGQTILVAHNIDLAERIDRLKEGDEVELFGQYEWNERGGVIHWTHHDPDGIHVDGYILHKGIFYQ